MGTPRKRNVAALCGDGRIRLIEQDVPEVTPGTVLVEVHASLVSPGTAFGGWRGLAARAAEPDTGAKPRPFGYANAGTVLEVGRNVDRFKRGDRVACMGARHALHTDYAVVPQNLTAALPDAVSYEQGAYAHLAATALHALRRDGPDFGGYCAVVGLGLLGQLTAQFYQLAGCWVIGWDMLPLRLDLARRRGIHAAVQVANTDEVEATRSFTRGFGLDSAVLAFGGDANTVVKRVMACMKLSPDGHRMGRIVVLGAARFEYPAGTTNVDILRSARTGPGYHDEAWQAGSEYPPVFVRWSTRANLDVCIRLMSDKRLHVDALTTHRVPLADVQSGIDAILSEPDSALGVIFQPRSRS